MEKLLISISLLLITTLSFGQSKALRIVETLNYGWLFHEGDIPEAANIDFDDREWHRVDLPHDFQIEQPWVEPSPDERPDETNNAANIRSRLSARAFKEMGKGWYRLHFTPNNNYKNKRILLDFGGIMYVGDVYVNGQLVAQTNYGYVGFEVDITKHLHFDSDNVISVMADTRQPNDSRWYTGGGLFRPVSLIVTDANTYFNRHPLQIITRNNNEALVTFECTCNDNKYRNVAVEISISDPNDNIVYQTFDTIQRIGPARTQELQLKPIYIDNAKIWDIENPNLYNIELTLFNNKGEATDKVSEHFGFRTIEINPIFGLHLNGKKVLLKGIANHHTLGALGAAAYPRAIEKRLLLLKTFGVNHIRTSHNPYSREFIELCDKYGILVVDELYDKWTRQHTGSRVAWEEHWQYDVAEWVKRDRNSPSVIIWSLGNELQQDPNQPFNDYGVTAYQLQRTLLHRYDTTRLTTVAMHPRYRNWLTDSLPCNLALITDLQAYNYRYMYFDNDAKRYPWMTFYQSEASVQAMGPNYFEMNLDKVIGLAYWGAIDYLGESQGWPAKGWTQGVFDISLEPKPQAYLMKSLFCTEPTIHISVMGQKRDAFWNGIQTGTTLQTDHWNYNKGEKLNIVVYTNADTAELIINGKSLGKKPNNISDAKERNKIRWNNVEFKNGYAEAIAIKNGKIVARHKIETAQKASSLRLTPDNTHCKANGIDLQHIRIEAIDKKGHRDISAHDELTFEIISGDAKIIAVSNGNQYSDELNVTNKRKLWNGSALVILRAGFNTNDVVLCVSSKKYGKQHLNLKFEN